MTTVLNKYHGTPPPGSIDIMRGSIFGNPFRIGPTATRDDVLEMYRRWLFKKLESDATFRDQVKSLHGKTLVCCCAPKPCHGNLLARAAAWLNGEQP